MGALARALDWRRTRIGPIDAWPQSLRTGLSILFESKFPMLLCWGPEFIQFYNDPFRPILGVSKHPALGKSTKETFAEAWHIIGPLFEQVMQGHAVGFEDMLVPLDRNGFLEECYFLYSYSPIRDESGEVGGVLVTCTETTGRVVAERRLRTLRDLASASHAQDEHTAWQSAAHVLATNAADLPFTIMYALDPAGGDARVALASSAALAPPIIRADEADAPWPLFRAAANGAPEYVRDVRRTFGDHRGPVWPECIDSAMVLPIARPGLPQPYGFLVAGISPRLAWDDKYRDFLVLVADQMAMALGNARAYEEERGRSQALLEVDRHKTAFFSNVSHEFRTPLTLMLAPLEEALSRTPRSLAAGDVELVYGNATRLLRLVNTMLDFSRIEAGRAQATFEDTDLSALTREIASTFQSLLEHAGLEFEVDSPPLSRPVSVDPGLWEKIVLNLLSNAFKFTLRGAVRVRLREHADRIELSVHDTGAGIPAAEVPHVFDRFHRVAGTPSRTFEGSGIGLALVRELVRMHGGEVRVDSVEGQGSTFTVAIPVRAAAAASAAVRSPSAGTSATAALPYVEEARRWIGGATPAAPAADTESPGANTVDPHARILVVDDNADMREYLRRLLGEHWSIDVAANGREALERMRVTAPDLIVTDVMMPDVDGVELLTEVRRRPSTRLTPVIMLSARSGEESRIDGLAAGADDYMVKPFSARELVARARTQLEVSRLRRETAAQNERLLTLINVAPAAIAVVRGPGHVYELANERYFQIVGRRDIVGKIGREALPELVTQGVWDLIDRIYISGETYVAHEFRVELDRLGNGELDEGFVNFVLQPLKDLRGTTEGVLIHAVEVTEQVRARRDIDDARRAAESANRAKDEFLAMLGHELRNPLAPILTALQLMTLRGDRGAENERAVIERQVRHVVRLVDDLLDVSRIASGKIELKRRRVELAAIVAKAVETTSPIIEQKSHQLVIDVPTTGLAVDADPTRLQQAIFNLLHNAAKYTEPGGTIAVAATRRGDQVELRVRDSGIGIESEMLPEIFDLFVQERQALDRAPGGLGLGLAIVRNLVELHGGRVSATSAGPGRGSEFVVCLPVSEQQLVQGARRADAAPVPTEVAKGVRVLIVDDNEDAATLLAAALTAAGFETKTAPDGPAAIRLAEAFAPDVGLLDLGLPFMDGFEVAERLRHLGRPPILIAVSGYGAEADQKRSRDSGFDLHLVKPVDLNKIIRLLHKMTAAPAAEPANRPGRQRRTRVP